MHADEQHVLATLHRLRAESGSHAPSITQIEEAIPGLVRTDACFLANPYVTTEVTARLRRLPADKLERMLGHYPSQSATTARKLAPVLGVAPAALHLANGACEVIQALLAPVHGPVLLNVPTFSAYHEFARGPVLTSQLDPRLNFRVDLDGLEDMVRRHRPHTVVIINPNNPDGGLIAPDALERFLRRVHDQVEQIIVDESFSHFANHATPPSVVGLVAELPHLVVVNSLSKNYGIAGLRLGYAVTSPSRARTLRSGSLWNLNAFAEWFVDLLIDHDFQRVYESARRRYVHDIRTFFGDLETLPHVLVHPSAANFALLRVDPSADQICATLLARHGIYVRDCADKRGLLDGEHYIRVAARTARENRSIVDGLRDVLTTCAAHPRSDTWRSSSADVIEGARRLTRSSANGSAMATSRARRYSYYAPQTAQCFATAPAREREVIAMTNTQWTRRVGPDEENET